MEETDLYLSLVFRALTKPPMFMGVDYDYFYIEGLVVMLVFIYSDNFLSMLLFLPLHFVGFILCKLDPHIFKLLSVRASIGAVKNKSLWHCQTYDAD